MLFNKENASQNVKKAIPSNLMDMNVKDVKQATLNVNVVSNIITVIQISVKIIVQTLN